MIAGRNGCAILDSMFFCDSVEVQGGRIVFSQQEVKLRINLVSRVERIMKLIISTDESLFTLELKNGVVKIRPTPIGVKLLSVLRHDTFEIFKVCQSHKFNPYFDLFYTCVKRGQLLEIPSCVWIVFNDGAKRIAKRLNRYVAKIRKIVRGERFKSKLKSHRRSSVENFKGLMKYIDSLFEKHSRLLVVRLDLGYKEAYREQYGISFEDAHRHRKKLLYDLGRCKVIGGLEVLGFAWKLELGMRKGLHYHVLLFFDGALACRDIQIARSIGEYWNGVITEGNGVYYNCNAAKEVYKYCGVGLVHYANTDARQGVRLIAEYMTKLDEYFKLSAGNSRCFGKGGAPKKPIIKRGRPRGIVFD